MTVEYRVQDTVAVLTLSNPPVNGLGVATRQALIDGLARALADPAVCAIVLHGADRGFCGGADIREFGLPAAIAEPNLLTVIDRVEASSKPVVAALHGACMGGGTELALGAHYRVALRGAQIGLPEVKIGLVPGAGGTQRLPRAVGLEVALEMIVSGNPVPVEALAALPGQRLLDACVERDLLAAAVDFAKAKAALVAPLPKLREREVARPEVASAEVASPEVENSAIDAQFQRARAAANENFPAQLACIECLEAAVRRPFEQGIRIERAAFARLLDSPESRALRHAFFAERAAAKIADLPQSTPTRAIRRVGIVGAGTMGSGIAMSFLNADFPVVLLETSQGALERGVAMIEKNYQSSLRKGTLTAAQLSLRMAQLSPTLELSDLADCDLIIEAVFEDMAVKQSVFRRLDAIAKPGAILASNTSTLNIDQIAASTGRASDVLGLHFFSPANIMRLLEVVRAAQTAPEVLATAMATAKAIKKVAVVSGVCDGFIGNRMIEQYSRQAGFLLEEGALPAQVDAAMERFGFAMGPFRMSDLAGNDIAWAIRKRRYLEQPTLRYAKVFDRLCETSRFGQKTSAGWYDYRPGERSAYPSPRVDALVVASSAVAGVQRRSISDAEIVQRLVYALINEGAKILQEGIASKASDIDMVYLTGYGFPLFRGGPMRYADEVGLADVLRAMQGFAAADPQDRQAGAWQPAPLLLAHAAAGISFT